MASKFELMVSTVSKGDIYLPGYDDDSDSEIEELERLTKIFWDVLYDERLLTLGVKSKHHLQLHKPFSFLKTMAQDKQFLSSVEEKPAPFFSLEFKEKETLTALCSYPEDHGYDWTSMCHLYVSGKEISEPEDILYTLFIEDYDDPKVNKIIPREHSVLAVRLRLDEEDHDANERTFMHIQAVHELLKMVKNQGLKSCTLTMPDFKQLYGERC